MKCSRNDLQSILKPYNRKTAALALLSICTVYRDSIPLAGVWGQRPHIASLEAPINPGLYFN